MCAVLGAVGETRAAASVRASRNAIFIRPVGRGFQQSSGRIIGVGRLLQASLFLIAIIADDTQPAQTPVAVYGLLGFYVTASAAIAAATWSNWWLDAKIAGPAHALDILMFLVLAVATSGQTSPFFVLFVFLLLAAAIRWSWRASVLTAALLILLYLIAGLIITRLGDVVAMEPFLIGTGHLLMLALILILFGASQWRPRSQRADQTSLPIGYLDQLPLETALRGAMSAARASTGLFVWRSRRSGEFTGPAIRGADVEPIALSGRALVRAIGMGPFVYDFAEDRGLTRDQRRNLPDIEPNEVIAPVWRSRLGLSQGLAIPIRSDEGEGAIFLERVAGLSVDHIELGEQIAAEVAARIRRHALLKWADENAEARSRLSLARDLHDSIVQFLAGAAFRLEAMKRAQVAGRTVESDLNELKQLMLHEQSELRGFITALRSGPSVPYRDLVTDLEELAGRLSRQWGIRCRFTALPADMMIPTRFHLNARQLMREAVANAVRHADSKSVTTELSLDGETMRLKFINDGAAFKLRGGKPEMPASMQERVEQAGGTIDLSRGMDVTKIAIAMPIVGGRL